MAGPQRAGPPFCITQSERVEGTVCGLVASCGAFGEWQCNKRQGSLPGDRRTMQEQQLEQDVASEAVGAVGDAQGASQPYVGRWHDLVSVTNWEKGRIICEWREALIGKGVPSHEYSDESWSRQVGGVSSQHVGRLRRVSQRFGDVYGDYKGLYWSHFHGAIDWNDAELWLEGTVQNGWSVAQMRAQRWEAIGAPDELKPRDEDVLTAELDEDVNPEWDGETSTSAGPITEVQSPGTTADDDQADAAQDAETSFDDSSDSARDPTHPPDQAAEQVARSRPFEDLPPLPDDLAEAVEVMKLAIVAQRMEGWTKASRDDVLKTLDALKALVTAPAEE